jgi:hypothetical protein
MIFLGSHFQQESRKQMVGKPSAEIDPLLELLLSPASDQQTDQFLSQLIDAGAAFTGTRTMALNLRYAVSGTAAMIFSFFWGRKIRFTVK